MSDEKRYPNKEFESMMASEPAAGYAMAPQEPVEFLDEPEILDYNFQDEDFGYPRTIQELQAALDLADEERNDPSKWVSSIEFHQRLGEKYPWLR